MSSSSANPSYYAMDVEAYLDFENADFENADFSWMGATTIDDDDLMFGGKPLCAWHEEECQRFNTSYDEEEHRGRGRVRREYSSHSSADRFDTRRASDNTTALSDSEAKDGASSPKKH